MVQLQVKESEVVEGAGIALFEVRHLLEQRNCLLKLTLTRVVKRQIVAGGTEPRIDLQSFQVPTRCFAVVPRGIKRRPGGVG